MVRLSHVFALLLFCSSVVAYAQPPKRQTVEVEKGVELEVLDWGGAGRPLLFLAGFGGTASSFDGFAQRFTDTNRVYSITRRGFGSSSHPEPVEANYTAERLANDVMTVTTRLGLKRPILVGHSIAGQELSEIGTRRSKEVAGLIYLEAAEPQAFYGPRTRAVYPIAAEVRRDLALLSTAQPSEGRKLVEKLRRDLHRLHDGLDWYEAALEGENDRPAEFQAGPRMALQAAVMNGFRIYSKINAPILAIVAAPPKCDKECSTKGYRRRAADARTQAEDFAKLNPNARVVLIPDAGHFIWKTNEQRVEAEMNAFISKLQR